MIKAILFDYGGVMCEEKADNLLSVRLSKVLNITEDRALELIFHGLWRKLLTGRATEKQFWDSLEKEFGKQIDKSLRGVWNTWEDLIPLPEMVELVKTLKKDRKVVLLSNIISTAADDVEAHGGYDIFDVALLSCRIGAAKPDIEAYEIALANLPGVKPDEIVFIDDQERCLEPAQKLGIKTILAKNPAQIKKDLEKLLS